jgi:hypothetical protein
MRFVDERNADPADAWRLRHKCVNVVNQVLHNGIDPNAAVPVVVPAAPNDPDVAIAIPPPPPVHDFAAIYRENFGFENDEDNAADVWAADAYAYANAYAQNNINDYNINHYIQIQNADVDDDLPARG